MPRQVVGLEEVGFTVWEKLSRVGRMQFLGGRACLLGTAGAPSDFISCHAGSSWSLMVSKVSWNPWETRQGQPPKGGQGYVSLPFSSLGAKQTSSTTAEGTAKSVGLKMKAAASGWSLRVRIQAWHPLRDLCRLSRHALGRS